MFNHWIEDQKDKVELAKNHAYLIGSFTNPDAVKHLLDDGNKHSSTDEEFDESTRMVMEANKHLHEEENKTARRRRHRLKG